jgi:hypothetical protein
MDMRAPPILCLVIMILGFGCASAKNYCPATPQPKKEGDLWYIPEAAFTKDAADKAMKDLSIQTGGDVGGRDFFQVDNDLIMIKGYLYRAYLAEHEKAFGSEDLDLKKEFCDFLKTKAHISH